MTLKIAFFSGEDGLIKLSGEGRLPAPSPSAHFVAHIPLPYETIAAMSRFGKHPPNRDAVNGFVTHPL